MERAAITRKKSKIKTEEKLTNRGTERQTGRLRGGDRKGGGGEKGGRE